MSFSVYNVHMSSISFAWDERKNRTNKRKHGVTFEEAASAFRDDRAMVFFDPDHSDEEDRFLLLGLSFNLRILVVCHCFRESDTVIRIISARKADKDEEGVYSGTCSASSWMALVFWWPRTRAFPARTA